MRTAGLHPGDLVEVNVRGRTFAATFHGCEDGRVRITPLDPWVTYHRVRVRAVLKRIARGAGPGQLPLPTAKRRP